MMTKKEIRQYVLDSFARDEEQKRREIAEFGVKLSELPTSYRNKIIRKPSNENDVKQYL